MTYKLQNTLLPAVAAAVMILTGCASVPREILSPADITVEELDARVRKALDPEGRFAAATSYVQRQVVSTERFLDDPETSLVDVKYQRPDKLSMTTLEDNAPRTKIIISGDNGWLADYRGKQVIDIGAGELDGIRMFINMFRPDTRFGDVYAHINIEKCLIPDDNDDDDDGGDLYYKLTCSNDPDATPVIIYIDADDYTISRVTGEIQRPVKLPFDTRLIRCEMRDGVVVPIEMETVMGGRRERTTVIRYALDVPIDPEEFYPPVIGMKRISGL